MDIEIQGGCRIGRKGVDMNSGWRRSERGSTNPIEVRMLMVSECLIFLLGRHFMNKLRLSCGRTSDSVMRPSLFWS